MYNQEHMKRSVLRDFDENCEKAFHRFFHNYLYPNLSVVSFEQSLDMSEQIAGIDTWITGKNNKRIAIDEKIAAHYLNTNKSNFVLELITPYGHKGWFINDDLKTDVYLFGWGRLQKNRFPVYNTYDKNDYFKHMDYEDITGVYLLFLEKSKLRDYFTSKGLDSDTLYAFANDCRNKTPNGENKSFKLFDSDNKLLFGVRDAFCSGQLQEKPVNIVVRQELLFKLSFHSYFLTVNNLFTVKKPVIRMNEIDKYFTYIFERS